MPLTEGRAPHHYYIQGLNTLFPGQLASPRLASWPAYRIFQVLDITSLIGNWPTWPPGQPVHQHLYGRGRRTPLVLKRLTLYIE